MKRYELKDKERQAALEKVFPGFGRRLNEACAVCPADTVVHISSRRVAGQDFPHFYELSFPRSIIEEVVAYDLKGWNNYPEVTPPEGVWMRCEGETADGRIIRDAAIFLRGKWRWWEVGPDAGMLVTFDIKRFRPWDEEAKDE